MKFGSKQGKPSLSLVLILFLLSLPIIGTTFSKQIGDELVEVETKFEDGMQIIRSKTKTIFTNVKWVEIQVAGIKATEKSLNGFMQMCERLKLEFGSITVYADVEARVMWVYSDSSNDEVETEAYYVQFS